jgi:hypothetical protein
MTHAYDAAREPYGFLTAHADLMDYHFCCAEVEKAAHRRHAAATEEPVARKVTTSFF